MKRVHVWVAVACVAVACVALVAGSVFAGPLRQRAAVKTPAAPAAQEQKAEDGKLHILVFGAHPDDPEIRAGGSAILWSQNGHKVELVSATNGDVGHSVISGVELAARRYAEVQQAAKILGTTTTVLDIHDGELMPTLENRKTFTRLIRNWKADIVIGHRPNDYHPDHRYVGILMQDSAFMVTVPFFCPDTPYLAGNPVFLYSQDNFDRPNPFRPDVVVAIDSVVEKKIDALMTMESQFVEGGANGYRQGVPKTEEDRQKRRQQSRDGWHKRFAGTADKYREKLIELYGPEEGRKVKYAEAFEICEYGRRPSAAELRRLFPFFPEKK